ncbi:head vertex subunit precursor [Pectobacterium bacteriophage PM2]|uniref:Capsid vertex protein n=1 Tax=Pectobacterium bacteriophage PM2 TaxID=1429794 RepID=A0A0A0PZK8_9CAUD|nr:head vertex subunit precursor [Pectobacterium bacteriophage PM2]AHY25159.1 head vertex subunit precursor [Pectobacterium bacteriophage PM2]
MSKIQNLLIESTTTVDSSTARPNLVGLTRATTKLIYGDLVAEQRTTQPIAALYGIKYLTPDNEFSFATAATYAGEVGYNDRQSITNFTQGISLVKDDLFQFENVVYKALQDDPLNGITGTDSEVLQEALVALTIRLVPDAAETSRFESGDGSAVSEAKFQINKWKAPVRSRKLKSILTVELAQDLEANGFDAPAFIEDLLATEMADEINKDILQSLITISSRYKVETVCENGIIDLTYDNSPEASRKLYELMCEMVSHIQRTTSYTATYVVASTRVAALLAGSGWLKHRPSDDEFLSPNAYGFLVNGLPLYCDTNSPLDYVTVGVKENYGGKEIIGSLFYAPYTEGLDLEDPEHVGAFKVVVDPESLQPAIALLVRYALTANPYTVAKDDKEARIIDSTNMDQMAGQSDLSVLLGVKLPKIIQE